MTNEEILKLAHYAGFDVHWRKEEVRAHPDVSDGRIIDLTEAAMKFAALVASKEREKCISDINAISQEYDERGMLHERQKCINVIFARGVTKP